MSIKKTYTQLPIGQFLAIVTKHLTQNDKAFDAVQQKDRRGRLKLDIQAVYGLIYHKRKNESPSSAEIKKILKKSRVSDAAKLHTFCERAKGFCLGMTEKCLDESSQSEFTKDLDKNPAAAVFLLAQINNIAFKERSGNANTCAVCSVDNAQRMQTIQAEEDGQKNQTHTKAQRLPAIPTRVIDGAVMRMARIVGDAIAKDKWQIIEAELEADKKVCVPIITESDRFEFEPSLKTLKGKTLSDKDKKGASGFVTKEDRIKSAAQGISAYSGSKLLGVTFNKSKEELDHIIPRSGDRGILNDEANLICVSKKDNREKGKDIYNLSHLDKDYKKTLFGHKTNDQIKEWIITTIWEEKDSEGKPIPVKDFTYEGDQFKFGSYRSFINLTADEQKAFRHALFLVGVGLRDKVINAIDNRNRALVNGTQRYFAEVLANTLYKKAKRIGREKQLSFDYFGVEAQSSTRGNGIYDLRKDYEKVAAGDVERFAKESGKAQDAYSHLIDAQLAFAIAVDAHRDEGSLKLDLGNASLWPPVDKETGELVDDKTIFKAICVAPDGMDGMKEEKLEQRKAYEVETHHRQLLNKGKKTIIPYQIHRDSIIGERFFPLLELTNDQVKKGFHLKNCADYKKSDFELLKSFKLNGSGQLLLHKSHGKANYIVWLVNKKEAQNFLMRVGWDGVNDEVIKIAKLLDKLSYQTVKKSIQSILTVSNKPPTTVAQVIENWAASIKEEQFKKDGILLPAYYEWIKLKDMLDGERDKNKPLQVFLKDCNLFATKQKTSHQKVRKVYSLPVMSGIGNIRLKRKAWHGDTIIQTVPEASLAKYGYAGKDRPHTILSKHSVPKKHYTGISGKWEVEPLEWVDVSQEHITDNRVISAQIKSQDAGRCELKLVVDSIDNISLPETDSWKGKIKKFADEDALSKAKENQKNKDHFCLSSEFCWFDTSFTVQEGRAITLKKLDKERYQINCVVGKNKVAKEYFSKNTN